MSDDNNVVKFKRHRLDMDDYEKLLWETPQRRVQIHNKIITLIEKENNQFNNELFYLWWAITERLIERQDYTPSELVESIRDDYGDDDDGESA